MPDRNHPSRRNIATAALCGAVFAGMVGMSFAAVPLYQLFCQVTGFGGTTQRADAVTGPVLDRTMTVRFDAHTDPALAWRFAPVDRAMTVQVGAQSLAFYRATNLSQRATTGTAVFNVSPPLAGAYFTKIDCFCFTEQTLDPGQSADMPVSFYIDPAIVDDPDVKNLNTITLSYTFYPAEPARVSQATPSTDAVRDTSTAQPAIQ